MSTISTEAWVLHRGTSAGVPGELVRETFYFDKLGPDEVLARPLFGCWEGNMARSGPGVEVFDVAMERWMSMSVQWCGRTDKNTKGKVVRT